MKMDVQTFQQEEFLSTERPAELFLTNYYTEILSQWNNLEINRIDCVRVIMF